MNFTASKTWILSFKKRHGITSRKILKRYTRRQARNVDVLQRTAIDFANKIKPYFQSHGEHKIFNTDQTGVRIIQNSDRTLEIKGTKYVIGQVTQTNALTHSYTIQPTVCADGTLLFPVFVVLQEKDGKFGPRVAADLFKCPEIDVHCSSSGLVEKPILVEYFKLYSTYPNTNGSILIFDSYRGYADTAYLNQKQPRNFQYISEVIPAGCTPIVQPLDNPLNRTIKSLIRRVTDRLHSNDPLYRNPDNFDIHRRNNRLKIISLVFNQLRSPRFKPYIKYAWFKCQYVTERPRYISPLYFCFKQNSNEKCCMCIDVDEEQVDNSTFLRCAWCTNYYCSYHVFHYQLHICNNYVA